ncbi:MAG: hypothetical protein ACJA1C_001431 [Crocinitomicaceae bacterium]|jgi:hypothetical protein
MFIALTHISSGLDYRETSIKFTKAFLVIELPLKDALIILNPFFGLLKIHGRFNIVLTIFTLLVANQIKI